MEITPVAIDRHAVQEHAVQEHAVQEHAVQEHAVQEHAVQERGAVLMIVAMMLFVLMLSAAFAVDFGSWYARAEHLQNAADAAALAGAQELDLTADRGATEARVRDVLNQNGLAGDPQLDVVISYPGDLGLNEGELNVRILDNDVDLFFAKLVLGGMRIQRDATALLDDCGLSCTSTLQIPAPFSEVTVVGSGDGFTPMLIGQSLYGVNHHNWNGDIVCVSLADQALCPGYPRKVQSNDPVLTDNLALSAVVGDKIYFHGQQSNEIVLACFDVSTGAACANSPVSLAPLSWNTDLSANSRSRGGAVTHVDGRIFAFTDNHQVHCKIESTLADCSGYPKNTSLDAAFNSGLPDMDNRSTGAMSDRVEHNGKIYVTTHFYRTMAQYGVRLHCWDTNQNTSCPEFDQRQIHIGEDTSPWVTGRLFFKRSNTGNPTAVCSLGQNDHECYALLDGAASAAIAGFNSQTGEAAGLVGHHLYHEPSNRLILNTGFLAVNTTHCWDWTNAEYCGSVGDSDTEDYGYAYEGNCIFALGHASIFWTFSSNMTEGCDEGRADTRVFPCVCYNGDVHWGSVQIDGELTADGPFLQFVVEVTAPDGTVVATQDLMDSDGQVSLEGISTDFPYLDLNVAVRVKPGQNPWATAEVPTVIVGWSDKPHLVK